MIELEINFKEFFIIFEIYAQFFKISWNFKIKNQTGRKFNALVKKIVKIM